MKKMICKTVRGHWKVIVALFLLSALSIIFSSTAMSTDAKNCEHTPPLIDRELFFGNPEISAARLSPDGCWISFLKPSNGIVNIWITPTPQQPSGNGSLTRHECFTTATRVSNETHRSITSYFWSRDGKYILYNHDSNGDENDHLFAIDVSNPAIATDLTPLENIQARVVSTPKETPNTIYVELNDKDPRYHDLYRLDISTGERTLLQKNTLQIGSWIVDKGEPKLAVRRAEDGTTELYRIDQGIFSLLFSVSKEDTVAPLRFAKNGQHCYALSNNGVDRLRLVLIDSTTGTEQLVDECEEVDLDDALFSSVSDELVATTYTDDRSHFHFTNKAWEHDYAILKRKLPSGDVLITSTTDDDMLWTVAFTSDQEPGSVYLFDRTQYSCIPLYQARPELPRNDLATMEPFTYQTRDGLTLHAYLTTPKGLPKKNLPLIVCPHGGPWARDTWGYVTEAQFFANRGYSVLHINFRGSTGYGKKFMNAGKRQWGDAMQNDITDGVLFLIDKGIVNPKKVAICGGSYGGYAALAGLAFTPDLYCAGVSIVGPSNLLTLLATIPPYWEAEKGFSKEHIGDLDDVNDVARMKCRSPFFSANRIKAPLLVVQGANDPRVKKNESDQIVSALYSLGREVQYLVAPDEGHGFRSDKNRKALAVAMEKFFATHLGGRCQRTIPPETLHQLNNITVDISTVNIER